MKQLQKLFLLLTLVAAILSSLWADDFKWNEKNYLVKKPFVILKSTKDYKEAIAFAKTAATKLNLKFDSRNLMEDSKGGLTFSKKDCEEMGWDSPCYIARGRFDDGAYISVEYSSAYHGFTENYYIVVAAGGSEESAATLKIAKKFYPDAYAKTTEVYIGCMH